MKSLFLFLSLSLMAFTASAECGDANAHKTTLDSSTAGITKINVSGMACSACVDKLSKEVAKITKSEGVKINVSKNLVTVDYSAVKLSDEDLTQLKKDIAKAVEEASFKVEKSI